MIGKRSAVPIIDYIMDRKRHMSRTERTNHSILLGDSADSAVNGAFGPQEIERRRFFTLLGAGVFALSTPNLTSNAENATTSSKPTGAQNEDTLLDHEEPFFAEFSRLFTISHEHKYLVASQKGSMPIPVIKHFKEGLDQIAKDPFPVYLEPSAITREKIAKGYGARTDEIAIARNTTDAISQILNGIGWR